MFALNGSLEAADAQARLMQAITDNTMVFMLFGNALCFAVFLPIWLKIENRLTPYKLEKTGKLAVGVFTK
jgi:hypothetical protein